MRYMLLRNIMCRIYISQILYFYYVNNILSTVFWLIYYCRFSSRRCILEINDIFFMQFLGKPWTVIGRAASLYTDPFIMLSGLLTTYSFVGRLKRTGGLDIKNEYIARLLRYWCVSQSNKWKGKNGFLYVQRARFQVGTDFRSTDIVLYLHYAIHRIRTAVAASGEQSCGNLQENMVAEFLIYSQLLWIWEYGR